MPIETEEVKTVTVWVCKRCKGKTDGTNGYVLKKYYNCVVCNKEGCEDCMVMPDYNCLCGDKYVHKSCLKKYNELKMLNELEKI